MKKIILSLGVLVSFLNGMSQIDPRCPSFKRNNGNGAGCDAKLSLYYPNCPSMNYYVIGILDGSGNLIPGLTFETGNCTNGKVDVCVHGAAVLPPAQNLSLLFSDQPNGNLLFACTNIPNGGPTPVSITTFSAKRTNSRQVSLAWQTGFEADLKNFIIQRKSGNLFEDVATITAHNLSNGGNYNFTDNNVNGKSSQYRLKAVDMNGSFTYSDIRNIKGTAGLLDVLVFPNPAFGKVRVSITDMDADYSVDVMDQAGRIFKSASFNGNSIIEFNDLPKGLHLIRVTNKVTGETATEKVTVL